MIYHEKFSGAKLSEDKLSTSKRKHKLAEFKNHQKQTEYQE